MRGTLADRGRLVRRYKLCSELLDACYHLLLQLACKYIEHVPFKRVVQVEIERQPRLLIISKSPDDIVDRHPDLEVAY
jgi:hypothetical protein